MWWYGSRRHLHFGASNAGVGLVLILRLSDKRRGTRAPIVLEPKGPLTGRGVPNKSFRSLGN